MNANIEIDINVLTNLSDLLYSNSSFNLTRRESEILSLMLYQWSIPKVATYFCRDEKTVYAHIDNIKKKTSCATLFDLGVKIAELLRVANITINI